MNGSGDGRGTLPSFGRGGRGAQLLQGLANPVRRPGQEAVPQQSTGTAPPKSLNGPRGLLASLGRGGLLSTTSSAPVSGSTTSQTSKSLAPSSTGRGILPLGRGIAGLGMGRAARRTQAVPAPGQQRQMPSPAVGIPGRGATLSPSARAMEELKAAEKPIISKQGECGTRIPVFANYIRLHMDTEKAVYEYHVRFDPEADSRNMRFKMLGSLREQLGETRNFDGTKLFLPYKLKDEMTTFSVERPTDSQPTLVILKYICRRKPGECIPFFNILLKKVMRALKMVEVGRQHYDPSNHVELQQHRLDIWPGYVTSIQEFEGGLMLQLDVSHRVLRTQTVLELMLEIINKHRGSYQDQAIKELVGTIVLTRYNNRTYRIDEIAWDRKVTDTFAAHCGGECTFVQYYKDHYGIDIRDKKQPLLLNRPKKRDQTETGTELICLVPELCYATGLTDRMREDFRIMKDLASHSRVSPGVRREQLEKYARNVNSNEEASRIFSNWGIRLDNCIIPMEARILPREKILMGKNYKVETNKECDWSREICTHEVITPVPLRNWMLLCVQRDKHCTVEFSRTLCQVGDKMGMQINPPMMIMLVNDKPDTYVSQIRDNLNPDIQMVVTICPTKRDDRYSAIKKLCCVDRPVPSQVINARTISDQKKLRSVTQKIALQLMCKMGGELWGVEMPVKQVMIVGIDVYHDPTNKSKSIAAIVVSVNSSVTRFFSRVCYQLAGQELVDSLRLKLTQLLVEFNKVNNFLPKKIIIFRDGVSDSQLNTVAEYEVEQFGKIWPQFSEYEPKLTYVIVQKRVNARVFAQVDRSQLDNPPPGTVVDSTITMKHCTKPAITVAESSITKKHWYDFYLISQYVRQGTVTPTHYIVVHDECAFTPDQMQRIAYKMTHMYYNWPGTVRVPAPCQYAHKLAYLVGQHIHKEPHVKLCDRLYYL